MNVFFERYRRYNPSDSTAPTLNIFILPAWYSWSYLIQDNKKTEYIAHSFNTLHFKPSSHTNKSHTFSKIIEIFSFVCISAWLCNKLEEFRMVSNNHVTHLKVTVPSLT